MPEAVGPDVVETPVVLCCLLWAKPGQAEGLSGYEDRVLAFVPDYQGTVRERAISDGLEGRANEVQIYVFPNQAALDGYLADTRRTALAEERDRVIERTELFPVRLA